MLKIKTFTFNMFGVNTYIVWNPDTREAAIIDPGMINEDEQLALDRFIKNNDLTVKQLINTHMHVDHIFGQSFLKGLRCWISSSFLLLKMQTCTARWYFPCGSLSALRCVSPVFSLSFV